MAQQAINNGAFAGDGSAENAYTAFAKVNANFTDLYSQLGQSGGTNYATTTLGAGTTNDLTLGGAFPLGTGRIGVTAIAGASTLTGMKAGVDGQQVFLFFLPTNTQTVTIAYEDAGSLAANRFTGAGSSSGWPPGFTARAIYCGNPNPRWVIG